MSSLSAFQRRKHAQFKRDDDARELKVRARESEELAQRAAISVRNRFGSDLDDLVALLRDADLQEFRRLLLE